MGVFEQIEKDKQKSHMVNANINGARTVFRWIKSNYSTNVDEVRYICNITNS